MDTANPLRPDTHAHEKKDCTVRALSLAANIPYERAHEILKELGRKEGHGIRFKDVAQEAFKMAGVKVKLVKRSGTANTVIKTYPTSTLYCLKRGHAFVIKDGKILDTTKPGVHIKRAYLIETN